MPIIVEQEVGWARRGWADAQALLAGEPVRRVPGLVPVSWYDTTVSPERMWFAVARSGGPYEELVGDILKFTRDDRSVFVYCLESADLPTDLAITRHAFLRLGLLALRSIDCIVEVV